MGMSEGSQYYNGWHCFTLANPFLQILNNVVRQTQPALEADYLRDLCCRSMLGLSRLEEVRQILSKLPLIANNDLQGLNLLKLNIY